MKKIRMIAALISAALCAATLASCQLSELGKKNKDDETTTDNMPAVTDVVIEEVDPVDFGSLNLDEYVRMGSYKGLKITVDPVAELTDDEFEAAIQNLLKANSYYEKITNRAAAEGDTLNIDFVGYMNGVAFSGGTAYSQSIILSENSGYIDGFADGLIGAMPGTTVKVDVTFPENYHAELAGKPATFDITVNYIEGDYITPELDNAFVTDYTDGKYTSVDAFREYYRGVLNEEKRTEARNAASADLWGMIVKSSEIINYPEQQLSYYVNMIKQYYLDYAGGDSSQYALLMQYYGITEETILEEAKTYTAEDLMFHYIINAENITISDEEYTKGIAEYAEQYDDGVTPQMLEEAYGRDALIESLLKDKVIRSLYDWADITVKG